MRVSARKNGWATAGRLAFAVVRFVLLFGLCFIILQPFASKILAAFMIVFLFVIVTL